MKFETLDQLNEAFQQGKVDLTADTISLQHPTIGEEVFAVSAELSKFNGRSNPYVMFKNQVNENNSLVFVWALNESNSFVPAQVIYFTHIVNEAVNREDNLIGDAVSIRFTSLPGTQALKGKVDTGAEISSLHADNWKIEGDRVHFVCKALSPNTLTVRLHDHQAVKSTNGVQYRPVVEMNVKVNDRLLNGVLFNLANRSTMDHSVLVGQNILQKGKFLIDPSMREGIDPISLVNEYINAVKAPQSVTNTEQVEKLYEILKNNNITFADLVRHIRTELASSFEDIQY